MGGDLLSLLSTIWERLHLAPEPPAPPSAPLLSPPARRQLAWKHHKDNYRTKEPTEPDTQGKQTRAGESRRAPVSFLPPQRPGFHPIVRWGLRQPGGLAARTMEVPFAQ